MRKLLTVTALLLMAGTAQAEPVVDITKIAGKEAKDVAMYLGNPTGCDNSKYGKKCQYAKGETEIVFIQGKADWITVGQMDHVPFSKAALGALGLNDARPYVDNNFTLRWKSIQGLREVSLFKGGALSDYAYIKVKTN